MRDLLLRILLCVPLVALPQCKSDSTSPPTANPSSPPTWTPPPESPGCPFDLENGSPLLKEALASVDLSKSEFGFDATDLQESGYYAGGYLNDSFLLSWFRETLKRPGRMGCFEGELIHPIDSYLQSNRPVSHAIRHSAQWLDRPGDAEPIDETNAPGTFVQAIETLCKVGGSVCGNPQGQLPSDLEEALAPLGWAMVEGAFSRRAMDRESTTQSMDWWTSNGGNFAQVSPSGISPKASDPVEGAYLQGNDGRRSLYDAASQIAFAIESIDWSQFKNQMGVEFDWETPFGLIRIRDGENHIYQEDGIPILLHIDLGGDDEHLDAIAANRNGANAISLAIDLGGKDTYHYETITTDHDQEGIPPADNNGRYAGDQYYGPFSRSEIPRQGAARNGIAMLFDLGNGNDSYASLRTSQGYAHLGVGILYDEGGSDSYVSEALSQGAAQFGIALLIDAGEGDDTFRSFSKSQGFGYVGGMGLLWNGGGNDVYQCNHGDPERGGIRLYYSPQLPNNGNSSFCQGAGFGRRDDSSLTFLSGGLGILRDVHGDDTYEASVFGQGTGYWQGTGLLSDGGGSDSYDAYWYIQGGAAHYAIGILTDDGEGDDSFNSLRSPRAMGTGAGHDFSVGVLINEAGNDTYNFATLAAGASNCNGVGLFVDNSGDDTYNAASDYGSGMGNVSGECLDSRPTAISIGIMLDADGTDTYNYPESEFPLPENGQTWGHRRNGLESEFGSGIDADGGETGIHPGSLP